MNVERLIPALAEVVGGAHVRTDPGSRDAYGVDALGKGHPPDAVVFPSNTLEIAAIARFCPGVSSNGKRRRMRRSISSVATIGAVAAASRIIRRLIWTANWQSSSSSYASRRRAMGTSSKVVGR